MTAFIETVAICTCLLILISSVTFLYIEQPGMAAGKKVVHWLRQRQKGEKRLPEKVAR